MYRTIGHKAQTITALKPKSSQANITPAHPKPYPSAFQKPDKRF